MPGSAAAAACSPTAGSNGAHLQHLLGGVYLGVRTFMPLLLKADEGHIINTSSVNGFWASVGPGVSHTAYAAAKFAVKGFLEALMTDLRLNAPHIKCSVGDAPAISETSIVSNSRKIPERQRVGAPDEVEIGVTRERPERHGRRHRADVGRGHSEARGQLFPKSQSGVRALRTVTARRGASQASAHCEHRVPA